jgi:hypothetical protein
MHLCPADTLPPHRLKYNKYKQNNRTSGRSIFNGQRVDEDLPFRPELARDEAVRAVAQVERRDL